MSIDLEPDGPICGCGRPSRLESGSCGLPDCDPSCDCANAPDGREGYDFCTHEAEPDYCDGCLCIRQRDSSAIRARVKEAVEYIDTLLDRTAHDHLFLTIRAILAGEPRP